MGCFKITHAPFPWDEYVYLQIHELLIFHGFHVGKYTVRPMDGMGYVIHPGISEDYYHSKSSRKKYGFTKDVQLTNPRGFYIFFAVLDLHRYR